MTNHDFGESTTILKGHGDSREQRNAGYLFIVGVSDSTG